jgi:hypothetical protein
MSLYHTSQQQPDVWERMSKRITDFGLTKKKRENPEKFNLVPKHDGKTG